MISNSFLALAVLFHYLGVADADAKYSVQQVVAVLKTDWKPGEIFIYVSAVLAPIPYVMYCYHRRGKTMPFYWLFLLSLATVFITCAVIYAYHRTGNIKNEHFLFVSSLVLYFAALLVWYFGLVLQRRLNNMELLDAGEKRANAMVTELVGGGS